MIYFFTACLVRFCSKLLWIFSEAHLSMLYSLEFSGLHCCLFVKVQAKQFFVWNDFENLFSKSFSCKGLLCDSTHRAASPRDGFAFCLSFLSDATLISYHAVSLLSRPFFICFCCQSLATKITIPPLSKVVNEFFEKIVEIFGTIFSTKKSPKIGLFCQI